MTRGDYLSGLLFALAIFGACLALGAVLAWRLHAGAGGLVATVAGFVYASAALVAVHLLPLALGVLSRGSVLAVALLALAAALLAARRPAAPPSVTAPPVASPEPGWRWALAGLGVASAAVGLIGWADLRSGEPLVAIDALTFHLPQAARWIESGSVWQQDQFTPSLSNWSYPHNGNLLQLAFVLPWRSTFAIPVLNAALLAALAVAAYAAAVELGAPRSAAALAAAALVSIPEVAQPAIEQSQVDIAMLAWSAAAVLFLLRHVRGRGTSDLVVGGIALGLAFGTKWYAVAYAPIVVVAFAVALGRRDGWAAALRGTAAVSALVAAAGGFWLLRNWVMAGNPVHPSPVAVGGFDLFGAPRDEVRELAGWPISHYLFDVDIWRTYLIDSFARSWGITAPLALAAAAAGVVVALRRRPAAGRVVAVAACALLVAILYIRLPYTAQGPEGQPVQVDANTRYLVPALLGGLLVAAWLAGRIRLLVEVLLLAAIVDGVRRIVELEPRGVLTALAVLCVLAAAAWAWARRDHLPRPSALLIAGLAGIALLVAVVAGDRLRARSSYVRYDVFDATFAWISQQLPPGSRIGLAGVWSNGLSPVLPLLGPRLENEVVYVGRFEDDTLRAYRDATAFGRAVADGGYDVLLVGRGFPRPVADARVNELSWSRAAGYREVARSPRFVLLAQP